MIPMNLLRYDAISILNAMIRYLTKPPNLLQYDDSANNTIFNDTSKSATIRYLMIPVNLLQYLMIPVNLLYDFNS